MTSCDIFSKIKNFKCSKDIIASYDNSDKILEKELFDTNSDYINTPYNKKYNINYILDNNNNYKYKLCNNGNNNTDSIPNCCLKYKNPWLTLSADKKKCTLPDDIELPNDKFIKEDDFISLKNSAELAWTGKNRFFEERWYDWFLIPNYHMGNNYYQESNIDSNNLKLFGNYMPCEFNKIPYSKDNNIYDKCVSKDYIYNGLFSDELDFSPMAYIVLLGGNIYDYFLLYIQFLYKKLKNIEDSNNYRLRYEKYKELSNTSNCFHYINIFKNNNKFQYLYNIENISAVFTSFIETNKKDATVAQTPHYQDEDADLISGNTIDSNKYNDIIFKYNITFESSYSNIMKNDTNENTTYEKYNKIYVMDNNITLNMHKLTYNISTNNNGEEYINYKTIEYNIDEYLNYKNTKLKTPDINLINLMDNYNCFDIDILKICYNISNRYKNNYKNISLNNNSYIENIKKNTNKIVGKDCFDINDSIYGNGVDKNSKYTIEEYIYTFFLRYYDIKDKPSNDTDYLKTANYNDLYILESDKCDNYMQKTITLANVFKKVSNMCFDNKTDFSKYIFSILSKDDEYSCYKDPIFFEDKEFIDEIIKNNSSNINIGGITLSTNPYYILFIIIIILIILIYGYYVSFLTFFISLLVLSVGIAATYYIFLSFKEKDKSNKRPFENIKLPSLLTFVYIFIFIFIIIMLLSIIYMVGSFYSEQMISNYNYLISRLPWNKLTYSYSSNNQPKNQKKLESMEKLSNKNIETLKNKIYKISKVIEQKQNLEKL